MRRLAALLALAAGPAGAWEFSASPVCTLSDAGQPSVVVTYDPRADEPYSLTLSSDLPWPDARVFGLTFDGPRGLTITTDRHRLWGDGRNLTVTDRGFGNVLDGLERGTAATAFLGPDRYRIVLEGAAEAVRAFRACVAAPAA